MATTRDRYPRGFFPTFPHVRPTPRQKPMTAAQAAFLRQLCDETDTEWSGDDLRVHEASRLIHQLLDIRIEAAL